MTDSTAPTYEELSTLVVRQMTLIVELRRVIDEQACRIAAVEAENARLRGEPPTSGSGKILPSFVKLNRPARDPNKPRKPRAHGYSRLVEKPTCTIKHVVDNCPDCGRKLTGGWVHRTRQVIEIPKCAYEVIEHELLRRRCGVCKKLHLARPDLTAEVAGKHRLGIRLMSLIVTLSKVGRMTTRTIQSTLKCLFSLHLSQGAIISILHDVAERGKGFYEQLKQAIRDSRSVNADETSWRTDGKNTYMWSFSNENVRLFVANSSRAHHVPEDLLGELWRGILCSDFYSGYYFYLGEHQRCWVHLLRDLKELVDKYGDNKKLARWAARVKQLWRDACNFRSDDPRVRIKTRRLYQRRLIGLASRYCGKRDNAPPHRVLAERMVRFANELFTFVEHDFVAPDNNAAERAIRPLVIYRKVTGGSRSDLGAKTTATLMSMVSTWAARGQNPLQEVAEMLRAPLHADLSHEL